ncbi:hypothetical protein SmJEL517_g02526 [Synchytrium microbalum]|uniref:Autophagy-related protein 27 n=1 Tax=Synchytrium microbalum TaxID=1806994 RepID=A0A507CA74_9FUNG|nr:uncharacterized protein SmJEL517_g02526 [Synchytrium microbalum]TPX34884.1 hypothetical protein SmJEL517_g02526 [Synchytrium microbalum]
MFERTLPLLLAVTTILIQAIQATPITVLDSYDCGNIVMNGKKDIVVTESLDTPPTTTNTTTLINICRPLTLDEKIDKNDQCPAGTWICQIVTNFKNNIGRVTEVKPMAQGDFTMPKATLTSLWAGDLVLTFTGGSIRGVEQKVNITMVCDTKATTVTTPSMICYDNNVLSMTWSNAAACGVTPDAGGGGGGGGGGMSGAGIFFLVIFLLLVTYCLVGSAYNYSVLRMTRFPEMVPNWNLWERGFIWIADLIGSVYERLSGRYVRL